MFTSGQLKQEIVKINNTVNQEIFGIGLVRQKVEVLDSKIVIVAHNKRVPALAALDANGVPTREFDFVLLDAFKRRLKELIESELKLPVKTILKDYDPKTEIAGTVIVLDVNLNKKLISE